MSNTDTTKAQLLWTDTSYPDQAQSVDAPFFYSDELPEDPEEKSAAAAVVSDVLDSKGEDFAHFYEAKGADVPDSPAAPVSPGGGATPGTGSAPPPPGKATVPLLAVLLLAGGALLIMLGGE
jgi:hypothetical protein